MSMAMGRPTEYKEDYCHQADVYLGQCEDILTERGKIQVNLPTLEGFSTFIDVNKSSLYEWEKKHPDFSDALEKIRREQKQRLLNMGLSGDYNSTIAKLVLSANHGMAEKTETKEESDVTISYKWNEDDNNTLHTESVE